MYIQTRQVFLGRCNEVWLHRFRSPPFGSPFHPFPFTYFFSLLFFHVFPCFMSCHLISFLLLRAHCLGPSLYMHNLLSNQASGRQVFIMRWVVIGCSCALGSFSLQPHTDPFGRPREYPRSTPCRLPPESGRQIYMYLAQDVRNMFKNIVFYRASWPSASTTFA